MTEATYRPVVGVHNAAKVVPHRHGTYDLRAPVFFRIYRKAADGADTLAIVARLHGVDLFITTNAENDA